MNCKRTKLEQIETFIYATFQHGCKFKNLYFSSCYIIVSRPIRSQKKEAHISHILYIIIVVQVIGQLVNLNEDITIIVSSH